MTAAETVRRGPPPPPPRPPRGGRLALGIVLILLGAVWFVETLGLADVRWSMVLPAVLVVIGVVLLATAHRGAADGLVGAGVVVSAIVVATSFLTIPVGGHLSGAGDVRHRPGSVEELEGGYGLGTGQLEVDLRDTPLPEEELTVEIGVAVGQLVVLLPEGATVEVEASSGVGAVRVDGTARSGAGVEVRERLAGDQAEPLLRLVLSVGLGQVEVRR